VQKPMVVQCYDSQRPFMNGRFQASEPGSAGRTRRTKQEENRKEGFWVLVVTPTKFEGQYSRRIAYKLPLFH